MMRSKVERVGLVQDLREAQPQSAFGSRSSDEGPHFALDPALEEKPQNEDIRHSQKEHMPHRVDPYPTMSRRQHYTSETYPSRRPSPPPIATLPLTHSPSPSMSNTSTPPIHSRGSPRSAPAYYPTPVPPPQQQASPYIYSPAHTQYDMPPPPFPPTYSYGPNTLPYPIQGNRHGASITVIYTEDASTKLSDRVRRRCFNCCTTDTSTWRRSTLSPGKVLCNKCGLFERTHSRPRPDQFPHKRGPLAASALATGPPSSQPQRRTPPSLPPLYNTGESLPPMNGASGRVLLPNIQSWHSPGENHASLPRIDSQDGRLSSASGRNVHGSGRSPLSTPPGSSRFESVSLPPINIKDRDD